MPKQTNFVKEFGTPKIMGILNATPDSFSDGGKFIDVNRALEHIQLMVQQGADIIDVGGESTRPGSDPVSESQEIDRVIPLLESAIPAFKDIQFSIDTTKYAVAKHALEAGAKWVNDVSGLKDSRLADLCSEFDATYILMHTQGNPKNMQKNPSYDDVVTDISSFFEHQIEVIKEKGVQKLILDPGIGFGKNLNHNLQLIAHFDHYKKFGLPLLIGASRKSMIGKLLNERPVEERLTGTIAIHYHAMLKGANILRVHDVKEASDSIRIFTALQSQS